MVRKSSIKEMLIIVLPTLVTAFLFLGIVITPGRYYIEGQDFIENGKIYEVLGICSTPSVIAIAICLLLTENKSDPKTKIYGIIPYLLKNNK